MAGVLAAYEVNVYREVGNLGVAIGAVRDADRGREQPESFARQLHARFRGD